MADQQFQDFKNKLLTLDQAEFQRALAKNKSLPKNTLLNLLREAYNSKRPKFLSYMKILSLDNLDLLKERLTNQIFIAQLCKRGTASEVEKFCEIIHHQIRDYTIANPIKYCLTNQLGVGRKHENQVIIPMIRSLRNKQSESTIINWNIKQSIVIDALNRNLFETAKYLLSEGAHCYMPNDEKENTLHLLYRKYSKENEQVIIEIRSLMLAEGVGQYIPNKQGESPWDICPQGLQDAIRILKEKKLKEEEKFRQRAQKSVEFDDGIELKLNEKSKKKYQEKTQGTKFTSHHKKKQYREKEPEPQKKSENSSALEIINEPFRPIKKAVMTEKEVQPYLEQDIINFVNKVNEKNFKTQQREFALVTRICNMIMEKVNANTYLFGSFINGLYLPQSAIDIMLTPSLNCKIEPLMYWLRNYLRTWPEVANCKFIKEVNIPLLVIKCSEEYNHKQINISYQKVGHQGFTGAYLVNDYLSLFPQLNPLLLLLKSFIRASNLNRIYTGGISGYGLVLMTVGFIQGYAIMKGIKDVTEIPVTELLVEFLRFFTFRFRYTNQQIRPYSPEQWIRQVKSNFSDEQTPFKTNTDCNFRKKFNKTISMNFMKYQLKIIDPYTLINVTKGTRKIREIRNLFARAYTALHIHSTCPVKKRCRSYRFIRKNAQQNEVKQPCCIIKRMLEVASNPLLVDKGRINR